MGIFESIKSAFSKGEEEESQQAAPAQPAAEEPAAELPPSPDLENESTIYTVQSGDTLFSIAEQAYGNGSKYPQIFEANRELLDSPDHILPGQELVIPKLED